MKDFLPLLENEFLANANPKIALKQRAYLKDNFQFYGIKTPIRRHIQKPFLNKKLFVTKG